MVRWFARWIENWPTDCTQRVSINVFNSGWQPAASGDSQRLPLGSTLSIFTRICVADTTKVGGEDNLPCEDRPKELHLISLEERRLRGRGLISLYQRATKRVEALLTKDRVETRHNINLLMVTTTNA